MDWYKLAGFGNIGGFGAGFWLRGGQVVECPANVEHYIVAKQDPQRMGMTPEEVQGNVSEVIQKAKAKGWTRVRYHPNHTVMIDAPGLQEAKAAASWVAARVGYPKETDIWVHDKLMSYRNQNLELFID